MAELPIPTGKGVPLVDMDTMDLPSPVLENLDNRYPSRVSFDETKEAAESAIPNTPEGRSAFANSPELSATIAGARSQNVAGSTSLPVLTNHLYELTATASATVTLTGAVGTQVAIRWAGTAGTIAGQSVAAGQTWVAVRWASGWVLYQVGGSGGAGSVTPGTIAASSVTTSGFTLTISGASGDLHATPYAFSTDNGATWGAYQASAVFIVSGKSAGTAYQCKGRVRSETGATAVTATVPVTTSAAPSVSYKDAVLADSPTHLLMMTDAAGSTVPARLGSGTGAVTANSNPVTFGSAALGNISSSATFPGTGGGFYIDDATFADATAWSAEAVVNLSQTGGIVSLVGEGGKNLSNTLAGGYAIGCGGTVFGSGTANVTRHIALVCDGATVTFYVNGAPSGTPAAATAAVGAAAKIFIGGQTYGAQMAVGRIAGVAIYKTALSPARVLAHATAAGVV